MTTSELTNFGDLICRDRDLGKTAVIDLGHQRKPREFNYTKLDALANGVARSLLSKGLDRSDRVALLAENCGEYLSLCYGIMRAGLVAVPINLRLPKTSIEFIIQDSGSKLIFCDSRHRGDCPPGIPTVCLSDNELERFIDLGAFQSVVPTPDEPAMFLYTSGSTGAPKAVILSHQSLIWIAKARRGNKDLSRHRYLVAAPLYHRAGLMMCTLACVTHATIVLLPQFNVRDYIEAIGQYHCTWLTAVPSMVAFILQETELLARTDTSDVEFIRMTAAPVSHSLMEGLRHAFPRAAVINAYAATEIGQIVFDPYPDGISPPALSVGRRHPQVQIRLVDGKDRNVDHGVLEIKSPAVMSGYHNRPGLPLPITEDGFYITNDVFRRDENDFYYFVGRVDDMFVCGGNNVYPRDLETVLERHPEIAQACVVPIDDEIMGQKPVAFIMPRPDGHLDVADIRRFLLTNAPSYHQPRFIWIEDKFPLTPGNKLDRTALKHTAVSRVEKYHI